MGQGPFQIAGGLVDQPEDQIRVQHTKGGLPRKVIVARAQAGQTARLKLAHRIVAKAQHVPCHTPQETHLRRNLAQGTFGDLRARAGMVGGTGNPGSQHQQLGPEFLGFACRQSVVSRTAAKFIAHPAQGAGARVRLA